MENGKGWLYLADVIDLYSDKFVDSSMSASLFGTFKTELIYHGKYRTRNQAGAAILDYAESFYNRIQHQARLGYNFPENYEKLRISAYGCIWLS